MIKFKAVTFYGYLFFGIFLCVFSLSICANDVGFKGAPAISSPEENPEKTPQIAVPTLPVYLSPYADKKLDLQYANLFFDPLVRWSTDKNIEKRLVKKWTTKYKGKVRFYLKENIKFHSGNKLTSQDVLWTYEQIKKSPQAKTIFSGVEKLKVINKFTFDIYTKVSKAQLLDILTHFFILDARFYRQHKIHMNKKYTLVSTIDQRSPTNGLPISGTGPFKINSFNALLNLKVERNNKYWGDKSALPFLNFVLIKSHHSRVYALIAGDVSISENVENDVMPAILETPYLKLVQLPPIRVYFLMMNTNHAPVFIKKSARDGLELAINQHGIVKYILNGYGIARLPWLIKNQSKNNMSNLADSNYDLEKAKVLFKNNKVSDYLSLLVMDSKSEPLQKTINALFIMLRRAGISLISKNVTTEQQWDKNKEKFDLLLSVWQSDFVILANRYHSLFYKSSLSGVLLTNFSPKNSVPSDQEYVKQINLIMDQKKIIPLFSTFTFFAFRREFNVGKVFSVNGIPYWSNLILNKVPLNKKK